MMIFTNILSFLPTFLKALVYEVYESLEMQKLSTHVTGKDLQLCLIGRRFLSWYELFPSRMKLPTFCKNMSVWKNFKTAKVISKKGVQIDYHCLTYSLTPYMSYCP